MATPFAVYTRQFTARLQARMHNQSLASMAMAAADAAATPEGSVADGRLIELRRLEAEHKRSFDPACRQRALAILQTLPLKSVNEDPYFTHVFHGLRACAHFGAVDAPATFSFLNHVTRHSYLLDAFHIKQFHIILAQLHHPQTTEIVHILLPRIREVVSDFSLFEALVMLRCLINAKVLDPQVLNGLVALLVGGVEDLPLADVAQCFGLLSEAADYTAQRAYLVAATPRICRVLRDAVAQRHHYVALASTADSGTASAAAPPPMEAEEGRADAASPSSSATAAVQTFIAEEQVTVLSLLYQVSRTVVFLAWGPRQLLNEIVRTSVAFSEPLLEVPAGAAEGSAVSAEAVRRDSSNSVAALPEIGRHQLARVLKALHFASYRHPAGIRALCSRIAAYPKPTDAAATPDPADDMLAVAVETAAYFYATDCLPAVLALLEEIESTQVAPIVVAMQKRVSHAASPSRSLAREEFKVVEAVVIRTLLSCARLLSACDDAPVAPAEQPAAPLPPLPPHQAVDPALVRELGRHMVALSTVPLLQPYTANALWMLEAHHREESPMPRRQIAGSVHTLYSIAVLLRYVGRESTKAHDFEAAATAFMGADALIALRGLLLQLLKMVRVAAEKYPAMLETVASEARAALEMVQQHPEWVGEA